MQRREFLASPFSRRLVLGKKRRALSSISPTKVRKIDSFSKRVDRSPERDRARSLFSAALLGYWLILFARREHSGRLESSGRDARMDPSVVSQQSWNAVKNVRRVTFPGFVHHGQRESWRDIQRRGKAYPFSRMPSLFSAFALFELANCIAAIHRRDARHLNQSRIESISRNNRRITPTPILSKPI